MLFELTYVLSFSQEQADLRSSRDAKRRILPGFKAGINRSNIYDTQGENFVANKKTGFSGGVFVALPIGSFVDIQPKVWLGLQANRGDGSSYTPRYKNVWLQAAAGYPFY